MNDTSCNCLYHALLTTRNDYCRETARDQYVQLVTKANALPDPAKENVIKLLNLAKETLGNLSSERNYFNNGYVNPMHTCEEYAQTIRIINQLSNETNISIAEPTREEPTEDLGQGSDNDGHSKTKEQSDDMIIIDDILDHRFRGQKLKLSIVINPGHIKTIEDEERVTMKAPHKVIEYLKKLRTERPRRINYLIRKKPELLQLLGTNEANIYQQTGHLTGET